MPEVKIDERGCRGCTLCADICPGMVFEVNQEKNLAVVVREQDCIGCRSCVYVCPSACIDVAKVHEQRPFYRVSENIDFVQKFIQSKDGGSNLSHADWEEAYRDVAATLLQLSRAMEDMVGRGSKAVGRQSGNVGATHLPEVYEEPDLPSLMKRLQSRFCHAIDFDYTTSGTNVDMALAPCRMASILEGTNEQLGKAVVCQLFHEYMAGLLRSYTGTIYGYEVLEVGHKCRLRLSPATAA